MTTAKKKNEEKEENVYVTETGLVIKISSIPPMLLQKVMSSVKMPERPTYEAKVGFSGRVEIWPLDEVSAKETEHGVTRWEYYDEVKTQQQAIQNDRITAAAFLFGTECEIPENGWDKRQEYLGLEIPTDPDQRRAHYLATELSAKDVADLMQAVLGTLQIPEEAIADAEGSFQRSVRDGSK